MKKKEFLIDYKKVLVNILNSVFIIKTKIQRKINIIFNIQHPSVDHKKLIIILKSGELDYSIIIE